MIWILTVGVTGFIVLRTYLYDVLKQFEIYYDIRFVKENPQIANPKLNGKFRLIDGVDYALRVLQREVGFSFRRDDEANVIYLK